MTDSLPLSQAIPALDRDVDKMVDKVVDKVADTPASYTLPNHPTAIRLDIERPGILDGSIVIEQAWAKVSTPPHAADKPLLLARISELLAQHNAVLVAHYYVDADIQALAESSGGCVADSLEMARFGRDHPAQTLVVAGVRFMGETAKILSPLKRILMPDLAATCSLDVGCEAEAFSAWCDAHPERTVVVYANTSAAVKARADWMVTSAIGLDIVAALHARGEKILWAPDRHLGHYIQQKTGADMLMWQGSCLVHNEFKAVELSLLKQQYPDAYVLAHPESPADILAMADVIGSTGQLIQAARHAPHSQFIVATDQGILYKMQQAAPGKQFMLAPTAGESATCKSCAQCPWMAMNGLQNLSTVFDGNKDVDKDVDKDVNKHVDKHRTDFLNEIHVDAAIAAKARHAIDRMLAFAAQRSERVRASGDLQSDQALYVNVGAA